VEDIFVGHGLFLLFLAVAIESAGVPFPGETALAVAAVAAHRGHYPIWAVIAVAALGAIVGDNIGYWLGREGGRRLLDRWSYTRRHAARLFPPAERFFLKHGAKTVFFGRFFAGLRVTAAWLAGISHMAWWRFTFWNALGGIAWATAVGLIAYWAGQKVIDAVEHYGLYAVVALIGVAVIGYIVLRVVKKRFIEEV
jgi:membrane protein DedA with SNARE-associated domain